MIKEALFESGDDTGLIFSLILRFNYLFIKFKKAPVISCNNLVITFERPWTDTLVQDLQNDSFLKSIYANVVGQEKEKIKNYIIDEETGYLYCKSRLCLPSSLYINKCWMIFIVHI